MGVNRKVNDLLKIKLWVNWVRGEGIDCEPHVKSPMITYSISESFSYSMLQEWRIMHCERCSCVVRERCMR